MIIKQNKNAAFIVSCLSIFFLSSCSSSTELSSDHVANSALNNFTGTTIQVEDTIIIAKDETFDGKGDLYEWVGRGDCSQTEGMPPMFVLSPGSTIKNLWMKNAPDGIHVKGSNIVIDNIVNIDVCEDAISISKSKHHSVGENIQIINSKFFHCEDKAIQLTRGSGIFIKNNEFYQCAKAIRVKEYASNIHFENNRVYDAKSAVKVTGGQAFVKNNYIKNAQSAFWAEKNGEIIDGGNNTLINVDSNHKSTENGKIVTP